MSEAPRKTEKRPGKTLENVVYIKQMLGQLRAVADEEGCDMLCYLIEMAYIEAGDIQSGVRKVSLR